MLSERRRYGNDEKDGNKRLLVEKGWNNLFIANDCF